MSDNRRTVSYFDHQFNPAALMEPARFADQAKRDMGEIAMLGFHEVVVCVTELDQSTIARSKLTESIVSSATEQGLLVTADPWRVGGVFGGEGFSAYEQNGGQPCLCDGLLPVTTQSWIRFVADVGFQRIFWDEPGLHCRDGNPMNSIQFIADLTAEAQHNDIGWNSTCVRTRDPEVDMTSEVAAMCTIDELAVAPYPFHPDNKVQKTSAEVVAHVAPWFRRLKDAATTEQTSAQVWVPAFNVSDATFGAIENYVQEIRKAEIGNVALWGYRSCKELTFLHAPDAINPDDLWPRMVHMITECM